MVLVCSRREGWGGAPCAGVVISQFRCEEQGGAVRPSVATGHSLPSGALRKRKEPFPFPRSQLPPSRVVPRSAKGTRRRPKRAARWGQGAPHHKGCGFYCPAAARTTCPRQVGRAWARTGPSERRGEGKGPFPFKPRLLLSSYGANDLPTAGRACIIEMDTDILPNTPAAARIHPAASAAYSGCGSPCRSAGSGAAGRRECAPPRGSFRRGGSPSPA